MSRDVDLVRRLLGANRSGPGAETSEVCLELTGEDVRFVSRVVAVEGGEYRGPSGVRQYFADMADAWQNWRNDVESVAELRPGVVLAEFVFRATSRSGIAVDLSSAALFTVFAGKVTQCLVYNEREEALAAAESA